MNTGRIVNRNTITDFAKKDEECKTPNILYRVTFGYKSNLSGETIFPVTYENLSEDYKNKSWKIRTGDLVVYKKQNHPNNGVIAVVTRSTIPFFGRMAQERGMPLKTVEQLKAGALFDLKFINPPIGVNNKIIKTINQVPYKDVEKTQNTVETFICEQCFIDSQSGNDYQQLRRLKQKVKTRPNKINQTKYLNKRGIVGRTYFQTRPGTDYPLHPLMHKFSENLSSKIDRKIKDIVRVGFLGGNKKNRPKIEKNINGKWMLTFIVPKGLPEFDRRITVPVINHKKQQVNIVVDVPPGIASEQRYTLEINPTLNPEYNNLKKMVAKTIKTDFKPTFIKASEYVYENSSEEAEKDLNKLVKPSSKQKYKILDAKIVKQDGRNFSVKKLPFFDLDREPFIVDLYVVLDLKLILRLDKQEDETIGQRAQRRATEMILNGTSKCPDYMAKVRKGVDELFSEIKKDVTLQAKRLRERMTGAGSTNQNGGSRKTRKYKKKKKRKSRRRRR